MNLQLSGKVAVVTGASRGIGLAVTRALADKDVRVVAGAREPNGGLSALADGGQVRPISVDLGTPDGPARLIDEAVNAFGGLDILVNNVGAVRPRTNGFLSVTDDDWISAWTINFLAAVRATRAALPHLCAHGGSIVTITSVSATQPHPLVIDYSAAKAALTNFCRSLSKEFGPFGVRVNTVSPGTVATARWLGGSGVAATIALATRETPDTAAENPTRGSMTGRYTRLEEVANLVLTLASDRAGRTTGADFVIDGGWISTM